MKHAGFMVYLLYIDVNLFGAFDYETNTIYFLNPVYFEIKKDPNSINKCSNFLCYFFF